MTLDQYLSTEKMTETAFAALAGLSQSQVNRLRKGKSWASRDVIERIAKASNGSVTANDLLGFQAEAPAE